MALMAESRSTITKPLNPNAQPYNTVLQNSPIFTYYFSQPLYYYQVSPVCDSFDRKTTVMIRNIPNSFSRYMLVDFLDQICCDQNKRFQFEAHGVVFEYDFVYLPIDFKSGHNFGYAFVNFTSPEVAHKFWILLNGYKWGAFEDGLGKKCTSNKICEITWANIQGKDDLVEHFKNSKFVCNNIKYLPVVFSPPRDGATSLIPPTTVGEIAGRSSHFNSYIRL